MPTWPEKQTKPECSKPHALITFLHGRPAMQYPNCRLSLFLSDGRAGSASRHGSYQSLGACCISQRGPPLPLPTAICVGRLPPMGWLLAMLRLTTGVCLIPTMATGSSLCPSLLA